MTMPGRLGRAATSVLRVHDAGGLAGAAAGGFDMALWCGGPAVPAAGLPILVDLQVDQAEAGADPSLFATLPAPTLDPRQAPEPSSQAIAAVTGVESATRLGQWWGARIAALPQGVVGARLLGLDALPAETLGGFLTALRTACPDALLFGWTPGLSFSVLAGLPPGVLDYVASSLPWWDGRGDWFWRELEILRRIAPVMVDAGEHAGLARQQFAALIGDGWMTQDPASEQVLAMRRLARAGLPHARLLSGGGHQALALLLTDAVDARQAKRAGLCVMTLGEQPIAIQAGPLLAESGGNFGPLTPAEGGASLGPASLLHVTPGNPLLFTAQAQVQPVAPPLAKGDAAKAALAPRLAIEAPSPCVDGGRFPARRTQGSVVAVECDVIGEGHDKLAAVLRWKGPGDQVWTETPMRHVVNDRWTADMPLPRLGIYHYTIETWRDAFATFTDELSKKYKAGVPISLELQEGAALVAAAAARSKRKMQTALNGILRGKKDEATRRDALLSPATAELMRQADDRPFVVRLETPIPLQAERTAAGFASWYEVFPRSMSDDPKRHGTFRDVVRHLPRIQGMGFDVLYFPPIHPIGSKNRKGRNNTLTPAPDDPGSPYAIGSAEGGHDALHPELGTIEDFQHLRMAAAEHGLELAMDFAIQCSPNHPWLEQHKDWFNWRPDGSIRYAENPPKKYEDIVNVEFYAPGAVPGLWLALADSVLYWARQGVRLFRVDNPHTKTFPFWEWMIAEVQSRFPDTVFLAEAFTRPKVMYRLAKIGFSQSYTYFTWRDTKWELREYFTELSQGAARDFFRPHLFVNTPDINPIMLHTSGRPGFLIRAALAATLSGLWGVYNGFELCEGTPTAPGKEEYLDSEKYEIRAWDWDRPGNITAEIAQLNFIRKMNPALHSHLGITFLDALNDQVIFYEKATPDRSNVVLVAISLDVRNTQRCGLSIPFWRYTPEPHGLDVADLVHGGQDRWYDRWRDVTLTPEHPYAIWRISPAG